jgi:sporulation protein YlmC with PRC-barrel domain
MLSCSDLTGMDVRNSRGEDLGRIKDVMLDIQSGKIQYLVVSFGGFLGIGDKYFAVPLQAIQLDPVDEFVLLDVDKDRLQHAPGFDKDNWPRTAQPEFLSSMYNFYGLSESDEDVVRRSSANRSSGAIRPDDLRSSSSDESRSWESGSGTIRAGEDSLVGGHDITWNKTTENRAEGDWSVENRDRDFDVKRSDDADRSEGIIEKGRETLGNLMNENEDANRVRGRVGSADDLTRNEGDLRDLGDRNVHGHVSGDQDRQSRERIISSEDISDRNIRSSSDMGSDEGRVDLNRESADRGTFEASTGYPDKDDRDSLLDKGRRSVNKLGDHIRGDHDHDGIRDKNERRNKMDRNRDLDRDDLERERDRNRIEGSLDSTRRQDDERNDSLLDKGKRSLRKAGDHIRGDHDHDGVRDRDEVRGSVGSDRDLERENDRESLWERGKRAMRNLGDKLSGDDDARDRENERKNFEHRSRGNISGSSDQQRMRSGQGSGDALNRNAGNDIPRPNVTGPENREQRSGMESGQSWRGSEVTGSAGTGNADPTALGNDYSNRDEFPGTNQRSGVEGRSMPANDAEEYGRVNRERDDLRDTNRDTMSNPPTGSMGTGRSSDIRGEGRDSFRNQRPDERNVSDEERRRREREQRGSDSMDEDLRDDPVI